MDWKGRRVVIVGAARQGTALAAYLAGKGAKVTLTDARPADQLQAAQDTLADYQIDWQLGGHPESMLKKADLLCLSGGVPMDIPLVKAARKAEIPLSNDAQLFMESTPASVIGVTGSAGKSTTVTLVARMLRTDQSQDARRVWLGGNLGNPLISVVDEMGKDDLAVMELSSFQLELATVSPHIAAVLNLSPNHLDRHGNMANYAAAKAHILDFQTEDDVALLNRDNFGSWAMAKRVQGQLWSFGKEALKPEQLGVYLRGRDIWLRTAEREERALPVSAIELRGEHNLYNVMAAVAICGALGLDSASMHEALRDFRGVPHRLEWVRSVDDVDWYNDSIATSPERAAAAVRSFRRPVVLLAGGRDKGLDWAELQEAAKSHVRRLIAFGEAAEAIAEAFASARDIDVEQVAGLDAAVERAASVAKKGEVVLLAPGGTSFDEFADFEERGERFRELVRKL